MKNNFKNNSHQDSFKQADSNKKTEQTGNQRHHKEFSKENGHHPKNTISASQCKGCSTTNPCGCKNCCNKKSGMCK